MTDPDIADRVYVEPMTLTVLRRIIEKEKPDSILPNLGGQTGLNLSLIHIQRRQAGPPQLCAGGMPHLQRGQAAAGASGQP